MGGADAWGEVRLDWPKKRTGSSLSKLRQGTIVEWVFDHPLSVPSVRERQRHIPV